MRTFFSAEQLSEPRLAEVEKNLRACVHCGICTASCPTYVLLGDERDSPRGRIVMMQQMLEEGGPPSPETVHHLDRCLTCLGCRTACPSGVDYARLVETARFHIARHHRRGIIDRSIRWLIANVMTDPGKLRFAMGLARAMAPLSRRLPGRLGAMARASFASRPAVPETSECLAVVSKRKIALLPGCVQQAIAPQIDAALKRVLARRGVALVTLARAGCCGALSHHLGREEDSRAHAKRTISSFEDADRLHRFEGIVISASGCAAHLFDYPHLFRDDPEWEARARAFASRLRDFSDFLGGHDMRPPRRLRIACQTPCSQQHGLRVSGRIEEIVARAGHDALVIAEGHLCCGSAGSYSILQPKIAAALRARKLSNIVATEPDAVVSTNIGCLHHLAVGGVPMLHLAELIDWSDGGPLPPSLAAVAAMESCDASG